jgi:hypothetical protein
MLTQIQLNNYFALVNAQPNFDLYNNYYQAWLDCLNVIVVPNLNPNTKKIRLVGMESSPSNPTEPALMSPNYIFNPLYLDRIINGATDCYIYQIYGGHSNEGTAVGLTRLQALINLAQQPIPVILYDIFHTDGLQLTGQNRMILAAAPSMVKLGICDRLINIHYYLKTVLPEVTLNDFSMILACPPNAVGAEIVREINNLGVNLFPPTVNTIGGGICPSAAEIHNRIIIGY